MTAAATPSETEYEDELETASPSEASPSEDDENLLEGDLYEAVRLGDDGAVAFAVTAEELGLTEIVLTASPSETGVVFTAALEHITVTATAEKGVLPEDAEFKVVELTEDGEYADEYQKAAEALENSNTEYEGMMALDISFHKDSEEIEPDGNVDVAITVNKEALPEGVVADTLSVQHLAEKEDGSVEVEHVADAVSIAESEDIPDEDAAEAGPEAAVACFSVDSFSKFVITWGNRPQNMVTVTYVKDDGNGNYNEVTINGVPSGFMNGSDFNFADVTQNLNGYLYAGAVLKDSSGKEIATYDSSDKSAFRFGRNNRNDSRRLQYRDNDTYRDVDNGSYIDLIYAAEEALGTIETEDTAGKINITLHDYNSGRQVGNFKFPDGSWVAGSGVIQGLVQNKLNGQGYPNLESGTAMNPLFTNGTKANHLFQLDSEGYYYYDSQQNFATLDGTENGYRNFKVYNVPRGSGSVPPSLAQFLPYNDIETSRSIKYNKDGTSYYVHDLNTDENYLFNMNVDFEFIMPEYGKIDGNDMVFEFAGDDDVWVFVDGVLVLDMGGVHDSYEGTINFADGTVYIDGVAKNNPPTQNGAEPESTTLARLFRAAGETWDGTAYKPHTLKFFYFERGQGGSNCKLKFNIPPIPPESINFGKQLTYSNTDDAADFEFEFQAYVDYDGAENGEKYDLYTGAYEVYKTGSTDTTPVRTGTAGATGIIKLKDGEYARLTDESILATSKFYVVEKGVTSDKYDVVIDGSQITIDSGATTQGAKSPIYEAGNKLFLNFENRVSVQNQFNLEIKKEMTGTVIRPDAVFNMQLLLGESETVYKGAYTLHKADGTTSSETAADGIIELKKDEWAEVKGLIGGNTIMVKEINLDTTEGYGYNAPAYTMTGNCLDGSATVTADGVRGTAKAGKELGVDPLVKAKVTNSEQEQPKISVTKQVGGVMGEKNKEFRFTIEVTKADGTAFTIPNGIYSGIQVTDGAFTLKHGQTIVIESTGSFKLPYGATVTVTEDDYSGADYETSYKIGKDGTFTEGLEANGTLNGPVEVTFKNECGLVIPTGIVTDNLPWLLMFAIAFLPVARFAWKASAERVRRRREEE